ncbi:MAG: tetratricopeptide repeat protein [Spirochaetia bacterium]
MIARSTWVRALLAFALLGAAASSAGGSPVTFEIVPSGELPLGPAAPDGTNPYLFGGAAALTGAYTLPAVPSVGLLGSIDYRLIPTTVGTNLSLISVGVGARYTLSLLPRLALTASARGGYSVALYGGSAGSFAFAAGSAGVSFALTPSFSLGIGASYTNHFGVYSGIGFYFAAAAGIGSTRSRLEIEEIELLPVFPVFHTYYDSHPLGAVQIRNGEAGLIRDLQVAFLVDEYMITAKRSPLVPQLGPGESVEVPIYALFTEDILSVTEDTRVAGEILVSYIYLDEEMQQSEPYTVRVYNRNAMTWDDDRKAASFVTAKDPDILRFAKQVAGEARATGANAVNATFRQAMALYESMGEQGINYVIDPASSYIELSEVPTAVDYLQFPEQTLSYRAGDCDDLAILYSALLEAAGVETAFVTIPGHIYMAFNLGMSIDEAGRLFQSQQDLIDLDGAAWIPIETTVISDGFLDAWTIGGEQWRTYDATNEAAIYRNRESWQIYEPVAPDDTGAGATYPSVDGTIDAYLNRLDEFIETQTQDRAIEFRQAAEAAPTDPRPLNRLGALYARFGQYDLARVPLERAATLGSAPALVNLGNLELVDENPDTAIGYFERAVEISPRSVNALVGMAQARYQLRDFEEASALHAEIELVNPRAAERVSYLSGEISGTARASDAAAEVSPLWDDGAE